MRKTSLISRWAAISSVLMLSFPFSVLAATPQEVLNQGLSGLNTRGALRFDTEVDVQMKERPTAAGGGSSEGSMRFLLSQRRVPRPDQGHDAEGRFVIKRFDMTSDTLPVTLDAPVVFQWRSIGKTLYVRIESVPQSIIEMLKGLDVDLSLIVGVWVKFDITAEEAVNVLPVPLGASSIFPLVDDVNILGKTPVLRVIRVEKRETRADGHTILRARVRLNPRVITALHREVIKKVPLDSSIRREQIKQVNSDFAAIRKILAKLQMVAVLDETAGTLDRMEFGLTLTQPKKTCDWNARYRRHMCWTTSMQTIRVAAGISVMADSGMPPETPVDAITAEELIGRLKPEPPPITTSTPPIGEFDI